MQKEKKYLKLKYSVVLLLGEKRKDRFQMIHFTIFIPIDLFLQTEISY